MYLPFLIIVTQSGRNSPRVARSLTAAVMKQGLQEEIGVSAAEVKLQFRDAARSICGFSVENISHLYQSIFTQTRNLTW